MLHGDRDSVVLQRSAARQNLEDSDHSRLHPRKYLIDRSLYVIKRYSDKTVIGIVNF